MEITAEDIKLAHKNIAPFIRKTPLEKSHTITDLVGNGVFFKYENLQKTGSFKVRGAANKILAISHKGVKNGVVAASAGNHAQGVAFAATKLGIPSKIIMPKGAPITKMVATQGYGAEVTLEGYSYDDCFNYAIEMAERENLDYVHAFNDKEIITGQGSVGLEIIDQLPEVKNIIVPIGGGGLISGILLAVKENNPNVRIIGVQAEGAQAVVRSLKLGTLSSWKNVNTIADGIAVKNPGEMNFAIIKNYIDDIVVVDEEEIARAILLLLERGKTIVEGAGASTIAALIYNKINQLKGETVAVLSGGNIDPTTLSIIIERGMVKAGKTTFLEVILQDRPGHLQKLLGIIANNEANVISIKHDRLNPQIPIKHAKVNIMLETKNLDQGFQIVKNLGNEGFLAKISE